MKFAIQINCSPHQSSTALTAYRFAEAVLQLGHEIIRVFFYNEGIYHAFAYTSPPDDEINLTQQWRQLAQYYHLDLVICISAAQRRGLLSTEEATRLGKVDTDLAENFRISGLGQWVEATLLADRFIVFG